MQRRSFAIGMLSLLAGSVLGPTAAFADPPSWAPAHGWRRKNGKEADYTGKKNRRDDDDDLDTSLSNRLSRQQAQLERENRELRLQNRLGQTRRQTAASRLEQQSRQAEIDRLRRENQLLRQQRAYRP